MTSLKEWALQRVDQVKSGLHEHSGIHEIVPQNDDDLIDGHVKREFSSPSCVQSMANHRIVMISTLFKGQDSSSNCKLKQLN